MLKLLLGLLISCSVQAQQTVYTNYLGLQPGALPALCNQGAVAFSSGSSTLNVCSSTNNWTAFSVSSTSPMNTPGQMIYENSSSVPAALNIGSSGQVLTVVGGYPAWATSTSFSDPMTSTGDLIYSSSNTPTPAKLGIGSSGSVLTVSGGLPSWQALPTPYPTPVYPISLSNGGTGVNAGSSTAAFNALSPMANIGDMIFENSSHLPANLSIGSSTNLLTVSGGIPAWEAIPTWNQNTSGSAASVSGSNVVTNSNLSTAGAYTYKGNNTSSTATVGDYNSLILGTPGFSDTGVLAQFTGSSTAGYEQLIVQNTSAGAAASADIIVNNNLGTATTNYGDFGMNSNNFSGSGSLNLPSAVYLYSQSSDLVLATSGASTIHFLTGASTSDAMTINSGNTVATGVIQNISNVLSIKDSTDNTKILAFNASQNTTGKTLTLEPTQTTSQILKFPNITAGDSVATLGLAQTFSSAQTFTAAPVFSSVTASQALTVGAGKALTSNAFATAPAASTLAEWDANKNMSFDSYIPAGTSTATAAGTTALVVGSNYYQFFTGTTTQTVTLPVVTGLAQGQGFEIFNLSTGVVTVESSGANVIQAMAANTILKLVCINTGGGTGTASWSWMYESAQGSLPAGFSGLNTNGIIYATSASAISSTAVGSSGSVLTSNGAGVAPTFQAAGSAITGSYAHALFGNLATWTTTNTSYADPTFAGTAGFSTNGSGITVTAAASNGCGITFTPPVNTAVYYIFATIVMLNNSADYANVKMTDGTIVINNAGITYDNYQTVTLGGIYAPATSSAVTIKLQLAASVAGTAQIGAGLGLQNSLEFTVIRIF